MSREEALVQIADDSAYTEKQMIEDRDYILKKLDISIEEWNLIMDSPNKTEDDYKNNKSILKYLQTIKHKMGR